MYADTSVEMQFRKGSAASGSFRFLPISMMTVPGSSLPEETFPYQLGCPISMETSLLPEQTEEVILCY